ncbi:MAG: hypothetical protein Kapaf2KO_18620 [Candidatus Kapaibacteriales bacterium]
MKTGRIHHAALFTGSRGVGKTTTARIFARALNCPNAQSNGYEPCNECESCLSILSGNSLNVLEIDGASNNSVDDIRQLRESAKYAPSGGGWKVYIIDEVHMLSTQAFNALLKILEEPPEKLIFLFATTEPHKVLPTIISRTQRYDFRRMDIESITGQLSMIADNEGIKIDEKSLIAIAKKGDGSMRDSQSIFDQVVSFCGMAIDYETMRETLNLIDEEIFFELENAIHSGDTGTILESVSNVIERGYDLMESLRGLIAHHRNLFSIIVTGSTKHLITDKETQQRYIENAKLYTDSQLLSITNTLIRGEKEIKESQNPQIRLEMLLCTISAIPKSIDLAKLRKSVIGDIYSNSSKKKALNEPEIDSYGEDDNNDLHNKSVSIDKAELPESDVQKKFSVSEESLKQNFPSALEEIPSYISGPIKHCEILYSDGKVKINTVEEFHYASLTNSLPRFKNELRKKFDGDIVLVIVEPEKSPTSKTIEPTRISTEMHRTVYIEDEVEQDKPTENVMTIDAENLDELDLKMKEIFNASRVK